MNAWLRGRPASAAGAIGALIGATVLALWAADARWALGPTHELPRMLPACALGVLLGGMGAIACDARARGWRLIGRGLGGLVALLGLLFLAEYASGRDLGIERLLFFEHVLEYSATYPGRSSPYVAASFLLLGTALVAIDVRRRWISQLIDFLALLGGITPYVVLASYASNGPGLARAGPATGMALPTAIALLSLVAAILALRPRRGLAALILAPDLGAFTLRRMLPVALVGPLAVAFLRVIGERQGLYDQPVGVTIMALAITAFAIGNLIPLGRALTRIDTERRREADAVRLSEARLRIILESSDDVIFIKDLGGRYLVANPSAARYLGLGPEALIGKTDAELFPAESAQRLRDRDREVLRSGRTMTFEYDLTLPDGKRPTFLAAIAPYRVNGAIGGLVGIVHDITERKRAESKLQASEARFKQLAESIPQIVWIAGPEGGREYVNGRWVAYTGLPAGASLDFDWLAAIHPYDRDRLLAQWHEALGSGEPYEIEYRLRRHDGTYRWHLARALPIRDEQGRLARWFGTLTDIDDRKLAEEAIRASEARFRALVEAAPDGVFVVDREGLVMTINSRAEELFGYSRAELLGRSIDTLVPEPLRGIHRGHRTRYMAAPRPRHLDSRVGLKGQHKDGTVFDVEISLSPVMTEQGPIVMAIVRDVTERKRLLAELTRHEGEVRAAREAARLKDAFLSTLSHEIKTPLSLIVGYTELLQDKYENEPLAAGILDGTQRLTRHVDDLLTYSALIGGSLTLFKTEVCLPEIVESRVAAVLPEIREKGQDLAVYVDPDIPAVEGDSRRLGEVLAALLANAARFTQAGGHIEVRVRAAGGTVEILVRDDGPGMTAEQLERIWEPFGQAGRDLGDRTGGLGLGLKIARRLVELHGGSMALLSRPGQGTQATVTLPVGVPGTAPALPEGAAPQARGATRQSER